MRLARLNPGFVRFPTGTTNLSKALHDGKTLIWDQLAGHTFVLPPASGSGMKVRIVELVAPTSNSNILKVQNSTDVFIGTANITLTTGAGTIWPAAATSDTLTLNRTTTGGGLRGESVECEDVAPGFWAIQADLIGTTAPATPFSATVN